jgi:GH25 family lysozyme M1 (1,4-beta-N-acetylmuramidase)
MNISKRSIACLLAILMLVALALPVSATEEIETVQNGYDRGYADGKNGDGKIYAHGIDISVWQGENFDFSKVTAAGFSYVILRAGVTYEKEGVYVTEEDQYFQDNYANAKAAGLDVGVYFYSMARTPEEAEREAETLLGYIDGKLLEYPVYMDFEAPAVREHLEADGARAKPICQAFMDRLASAGYLVGLYSSASWIDSGAFNGWMGDEADELGEKYELWVACYYNDATYAKKGKEFSERFGMYQYTSSKYIKGYGGRLDANICYKDYPSIVKKYGFNGYEPDESITVGGEGLTEECRFALGKYTVSTGSSKVALYAEPDQNSERVGYVSNKSVVEVTEACAIWSENWAWVVSEDGVSGWMKTLELKKYKEPVPTDKPTEKVSESETIASTDAETDVTADGGCNATISLGVILFTCVGAAAVIKRKRVE